MTATVIAADGGVPAGVETWRFGLHDKETLS